MACVNNKERSLVDTEINNVIINNAIRPVSARAFFSVLCAVFLATACASGQLKNAAPDPQIFESNMKAAAALTAAGQPDRAIATYEVVAKENPIRKEPWVQIAKLRFEEKNYGHAIIAAEEVLQRDFSDKQAKSILVVSGLRVATQSLALLRPTEDKELVVDAQTDARALVKVLRENIGAQVLFPPVQMKKRPIVKKPAPSGATQVPVPGGNPFGALGK